MRKSIIVLTLLVAACGRPDRESPAAETSYSTDSAATERVDAPASAPRPVLRDVAPGAAARRGPDAGLANLPGMSMTYQYGFRVPIEHIATVQEQHASDCEAMTPYRCRVVGMTYQAGRNRTISATLNLKLAPADARQFGKKAVVTVDAAGGMLGHARIESEESGQAIADANRQTASVDEEREQITQQLARPGLKSWEREQLQARLAELADQKRAAQAVKSDAQRKLASTPMAFTYESGNVDPGFSDGPVLGALKDGWANIVAGFAILLMLAVTLLPWVVAVGLLIWLARRFGPALTPKPRAPVAPPPTEE